MPSLFARDYEDCYYDTWDRRTYCTRNAWHTWIKYVVISVILFLIVLLFILCSCITARRRRKAGRMPYYGTGWAARPQNGSQPYYNNNQYNQPAPPYSAQNQNTYGANQGYYGQQSYGQQPYGQQTGVELQPPQPAHGRDGGDVYAPPTGPPPGKVN